MKQKLVNAFLSACVMGCTFSLTGCQSSEETAEVNPTYNPETGKVNVDLAFNIATGSSSQKKTRMTQAIVQESSTSIFRGMDQTALMSVAEGDDGKFVYSIPAEANVTLYGLGPILDNNDIGPNDEERSNRVLELAVPVGTNKIMFWGKATKDDGQDNQEGKLESFVVDKNLANCSFKLAQRLPEERQSDFKEYETLISTILNTVVQSKGYSYTDGGTEYKSETLSWKDYVATDGTGSSMTLVKKTVDPSTNGTTVMCALGQILCDAYVTLNTIYPNELRAGSGPAVARVLVDLLTVIDKVAEAIPTNAEEYAAKGIGKTIKANLLKFISYGGWNSISTIKTNSGLGDAIAHVTVSLNNFPSTFNVPEGATILQYSVADNKYSYRDVIPTYNMGGGTGGTFNIFNYMYPAELCYFGNSPVRVTNNTIPSNQFPDGVKKWEDDSQWSAWTKNSHVQSSTRSVAMQHNINYGTSLLKARVKYGAAKLKDNNNAMQKILQGEGTDEPDNLIDVSAASPFELTGIIIGGQEPEVGWNYLAKTPQFSAMIYDNDIPDGTIPKYTDGNTYSAYNYTLVWDNWNQNNKGKEQNIVYIALEFKNNGEDFWGENNLIPKNGTFYITGKLDPDANLSTTDRSAGITWPDGKYALPPYNADGSIIKERRVFIQDYATDATFVIGEKSLQKALMAVPDLRATQISLGLSVDLTWQPGLTYSVVLGEE